MIHASDGPPRRQVAPLWCRAVRPCQTPSKVERAPEATAPVSMPETTPSATAPEREHSDIIYPSAIPFVLVHLACLAAFWTGITWTAVALCITLYWVRIFAIGAGYHRYFSHRAFATSRVFQFALAVLAQSTTQKSVLWWAAKHRHHHRYSDTPQD